MSPWILINCISLLSELGKSSSSGSNDLASIVEAASAVFEKVYSFLVKLLADKSRHLQQQQQQQHQKQPGSGSGGGNGGGDGESDADQSITYEIIKSLLNLIFNTPNSIYTHIHSDKNKEDSIDLTSHLPLVTLHLKSYLASASSTFKYLGLNLLSTTATKAAVSVSSPSNFNHVHANNILASCLDDIKFCIVDLLKSDGNSILKRKALDLLSALANKENYSACADQLLTLATATIQLHHRRFYQSGSFPSTSSTINTAFTSSDGTISSLAFVFNKLVQVIQHSPLGAEQVKWVWRLVEATTTTAKASSLSSPASTSVTSPSKSKSFAPLYTRIAFHLTQMVAHTTSSKINSDDRGDDLKECRKICLEYWIKLVCDGGGENSSSSSSSHVSEFLDGSLGQFGFWVST